jgi:signal transduction histidine kinase
MVVTEGGGTDSSRDRVVFGYLSQGLAGLLLMLSITWLRGDEPARVLAALGPSGWTLIPIFFLFPFALSFLKFRLTEEIFVSFAMLAFIAMVPLLGMVLSSWLAVSAVIINRCVDTVGIGAGRISMDDAAAEHMRTFGLFGTYGIPIVVASLAYEAVGGVVPLESTSIGAAAEVSLCGVVMIATNSLVMTRIQRAYGYTTDKMVQSTLTDATILALGIPYSFITTFSWSFSGWFGVVSCAFIGIVVNTIVRNLAHARTANQMLVGRLSSLTNIGKSISISSGREELVTTIYEECARVVDAGHFSIALLDPYRRELVFAIEVVDGEVRPPSRAPLGNGLNSWVVENRQPLLLRSNKEEAARGLQPIDDGIATESWLGVPITAHDRDIGVISVQSYRRSAFDEDDLILLAAVANQAAVAIENAELYRDLEGLNLALEQRVAERTNELRETNLRLIAADRTKNEFLAHMSHELRTPLNSVIGFSQILLNRAGENLPPRLYRFIENIHASGSHLLSLINAILDLAKIEAGRLELEIDRFNLHEAVSTVESVVHGMASDAGITIHTTVGEGIDEVSMDEGRVKQILINLLSNAIKFSSRGELVHLHVRLVPGATSPLRCDTIRVEVSDRGTGIPLADQAKIFDEFYQAPGSPRRIKGGTGLGLALTKRFVELHHGIITVDSSPGRGSTFTAYLPVHQEPTPPGQSTDAGGGERNVGS